jgi:hypothetical protein
MVLTLTRDASTSKVSLPVLPRTHAEGSWLGQTFPDRDVRFQAHRAPCCVYRQRALYFSTEHRSLENEIGFSFSYSQVLGDLTYAYVVERVDISYAVTLLARYSSTPNRIHYLALKRLCKYLRHTIDWEIFYWRQAEVLYSSLLELVGYVDASHATDLRTRRSDPDKEEAKED